LALRGGVGEKSVRQILEHSQKVCERALPADAEAIRKLCGDITTMTDALCELRQDGKGATPQVISSIIYNADQTSHDTPASSSE
jgi:vinculin